MTNANLYWHNCSICGARWIGTHTCDPTPQPTVRNVTLPPMSKLVIGSVQAENAQLRAALAASEAKLAEQDANRAGHPGMCCGQCIDSIRQAEAKLAALIDTAEQCRDMMKFKRADKLGKFQQGSANGRAWAMLNAAIARAKPTPHSADPSSAAPPVGNPATPPSGR